MSRPLAWKGLAAITDLADELVMRSYRPEIDMKSLFRQRGSRAIAGFFTLLYESLLDLHSEERYR